MIFILFLKYSEKYRYRTCLIGVGVGCAITTIIILGGVLPALIVFLTQSSTMNTQDSIANTGQYLFNKP
jgi:hypothetical protein